MRLPLAELGADSSAPFPPVEAALTDPDGLLAWGGDLSPTRLLAAYRHGVFPWFSPGQPILWWSPDPRMVLPTSRFHVSRRLQRALRRSDWRATCDRRFDEVIGHCADLRRRGQSGTWIGPAMKRAYLDLHVLGHAHCVEVVDAHDALVGGVYGVAVGRMFFGESMFSRVDNGSKAALLALCRHLESRGSPLLDCQMETGHLASLGAHSVPRAQFLADSRRLCAQPVSAGLWSRDFGERAVASLVAEASGDPLQ